VSAALAAVGARLKRNKKHLVYELPNGNKVTMASTPSDHRAEENMLRDIRRAAGLVHEPKPPSPPKPKTRKLGRVERDWHGLPQAGSPMAAAFRDSGLVEQQLRSRIGQLEAEIERRAERIAELERQMEMPADHRRMRNLYEAALKYEAEQARRAQRQEARAAWWRRVRRAILGFVRRS
jgi:hypothetical protein